MCDDVIKFRGYEYFGALLAYMRISIIEVGARK